MSLSFTWFSYSHFLYSLQSFMFYFSSVSFCPFSLFSYPKFVFCLQTGSSVSILYQFSYSTKISKILFDHVPSSELRIYVSLLFDSFSLNFKFHIHYSRNICIIDFCLCDIFRRPWLQLTSTTGMQW